MLAGSAQQKKNGYQKAFFYSDYFRLEREVLSSAVGSLPN